jgi:hypothetical protein
VITEEGFIWKRRAAARAGREQQTSAFLAEIRLVAIGGAAFRAVDRLSLLAIF